MPIQVINNQGQVKGPSVVIASTVAGLGTGQDGKQGMIRAGSSPYEFMPVTYDSTYGKWVSASYLLWDQSITTNGNNVVGVVDLYGTAATHKWRVFNTAGLFPQFRCQMFIGKTSGGANSDMTIALSMASTDEGANESATGAYSADFGGLTKTITGTNILAYDTGWAAPGAYPTVGDNLNVKIRANNTNGADAKIWRGGKIFVRWVA